MAEDPKPLPKVTKDDFAEFRHPDEASFDKFVAALDRAYHRPFQMMFRSFLHGMMTVLGGTVGAALIFIILFYALRTFDWSPFAQKLQNAIIPANIQQLLSSSPSPKPSVSATPTTSPY